MSTKFELEQALKVYYTNYYHNQLGLPDWEMRVMNRLEEEETFGNAYIAKIEKWLKIDFRDKKILIVGAGTGAESFSLISRGAQVYGIEPNSAALDILQMKSNIQQYPAERFLQAVAEDLPYSNNSFDFIYCYMVLEHVQNVECSIDEMLRVCKHGAVVCIATPDYRFPVEPHYKLPKLPFSPRWVEEIILRLRKKPVEFLKGINFVTTPQLDRLFWQRNVITMRVYEPHLYMWRNMDNHFQRWFCKTFAIQKTQWIFLTKQDEEQKPIMDSEKSLDEKILEEKERILRDVVELSPSEEQGGKISIRWKPRFTRDAFIAEGKKRLLPVDRQMYYDLQLSRGASRPTDDRLGWEFSSPEEGVNSRLAMNTERYEELKKFVALDPQMQMLEIGTRNAQLLYFLSKQGFHNTTGIDCVRMNVLWCQKNGFNVIEADAHQVASYFDSSSFDIVFAYSVLEHCYDPELVVKQVAKLLRHGGIFHLEIPISDYDTQVAHVYSFGSGEMSKMLKRNGLRQIHSEINNVRERIIARKIVK